MKVTPEKIEKLNHGEIFCFGSNESGIHGAGAAAVARVSFGAQNGVGFGHTGDSFALPTKDWFIGTLPLVDIKHYVDRFFSYVIFKPRYHFLITEIGCGLAGYTPEQIAPLFKRFMGLKNVSLPQKFLDILQGGIVKINEQGKTEIYDGNGNLRAAQG